MATEGTIQAASKKLHVTQPTISSQLKTFEEQVGYKLFDRRKKRLHLNKNGEFLLKQTRRLFNMAEEILHNLNNLSAHETETLRVGILPSLPSSFVNNFLASIWKDPSYIVNIKEGSLDSLIQELDEDHIDLILSDTPYKKSTKRYRSVNLGTMDIHIVGSKKFQYLKNNFPRSLADQPFISYTSKSGLQRELDFFFENHGIRPNIIGYVDDAALMLSAAKSGVGLSALPNSITKHSIRNKTLIKIGKLSGVNPNLWSITSSIGSKKLTIRKLLNSYLKATKAN